MVYTLWLTDCIVRNYADALPETLLIDRTLANTNNSVTLAILRVGFTFHLTWFLQEMFNWSFLSKSVMAILSPRYVSVKNRVILLCNKWYRYTVSKFLTLLSYMNLGIKECKETTHIFTVVSDECST